MSSTLLALLSLALLPQFPRAPLAQQSRTQAPTSDGASYTDDDYRFRLDLPGAGWKLQGPEEIRDLLPNALAGVVNPPHAYGIVTVQRSPDTDLPSIARTAAEKFPLDARKLELFEACEFQRRPAVRLRLSGERDEIAFRYELVIFENGGFVYQVIAWCRSQYAAADNSNLQPIFEAFTLLEGPVEQRIDRIVPRDTSGPSWRLRDGVYQNSALGVELRPTGAWSVRVGKELDDKGGDSVVELTCQEPVAHIALLVDRIVGLDPAEYEAQFYEDRKKEFLPISGTVAGELAGQPFPMKRYTARPEPDGTSPNMRHLVGTLWRGEILFQIYVWFPIPLEVQGTKAVLEGLKSVRFLGEAECAQLEVELASSEEAVQIGATWSLRHGVYRDFENEFQWTRPSPRWQIRTGAAAQRFSANTRIVMREHALGVWGTISAMPAVEAEPLEYHSAVTKSMFGSAAAARSPLELRFAGIDALASMAEPNDDSGHSRYLLVTVLGKDRRFHLTFWGPVGAVEAAAEELSAAVRGFERLSDDSSPSAVGEDSYRDERFGFELRRPGPEWSFHDVRDDAGGAVSSNALWQSGETRVVALTAMHGIPLAGTDPMIDWISRRQELPSELRERFDEPSESSETTVHGIPAKRMHWRGEDAAFDLLLFNREGALYSLGIASEHGEPSVEHVLEGLRFFP